MSKYVALLAELNSAPRPVSTTIRLGEGFQTQTLNQDHLVKYDLIEKDALSFLNDICFLVDEKKNDIPAEEWESLKFTLRALMVTYDDGELYYYLIHAHGAEAIKYNAWVHFASDSSWPICVRVFTDMPTEVLEEYGAKEWSTRIETTGYKGKETLLKAIGERTDIYGSESLPEGMVEGILFKKS